MWARAVVPAARAGAVVPAARARGPAARGGVRAFSGGGPKAAGLFVVGVAAGFAAGLGGCEYLHRTGKFAENAVVAKVIAKYSELRSLLIKQEEAVIGEAIEEVEEEKEELQVLVDEFSHMSDDALALKLARLEAEADSRSLWESKRAAEARATAIETVSSSFESGRRAARLEAELRFEEREKAAAAAQERDVKAALAEIDSDLAAATERAKNEKEQELEKDARALVDRELGRLGRVAETARSATLADSLAIAGDEAVASMRALRAVDVAIDAAFHAASAVPQDDAKALKAHEEVALNLLLAEPSDDSTTLRLCDRWRRTVLHPARVAAQSDLELGIVGAALGEAMASLRVPTSSGENNDASTIERADAAINRCDLVSAIRELETLKEKDDAASVVRDWHAEARATAEARQNRVRLDAQAALLAASRSNL